MTSDSVKATFEINCPDNRYGQSKELVKNLISNGYNGKKRLLKLRVSALCNLHIMIAIKVAPDIKKVW